MFFNISVIEYYCKVYVELYRNYFEYNKYYLTKCWNRIGFLNSTYSYYFPEKEADVKSSVASHNC